MGKQRLSSVKSILCTFFYRGIFFFSLHTLGGVNLCEGAASLMYADKKKAEDVPGLFGYSRGTGVSAIVAAVSLFVTWEFVAPQRL